MNLSKLLALRAEWFLGGGFAAAWVAKAAVDAGAPAPWLTLATGATALGGAALALRRGVTRRWLDPFRLVLILLALWELPSVYGRLGGDGYEYFAFAHSAVFDRDLAFENQFAGLGARPPLTEEGEPTSRVPIGQALVWLPFLLSAHALAWPASLLGAPVVADGFSAFYLSAITGATYLLGWAGLGLIEHLLRRRLDRASALLAALALLYATPLHFYLVANPFMSHGSSVFVSSAFVVAWLRARDTGARHDWLLAGAIGGLMSLVRAQDGVLLVPPLLGLLLGRRSGAWRAALAYVTVPMAAILAQTVIWRLMYGGNFVTTVAWLNLVGGGESSLSGVLLSPRHGLFTWTPLAVLCLLGWLPLARREPGVGLGAFLGFGLLVLVNANLADWWGSDAFGQRRLLVLLPLFGLGLAEAMAVVLRRPLWLLAPLFAMLAFWNNQFEYIYNSELAAGKDEPVPLHRLAAAQVEVLQRQVRDADGRWPASLWVIAWDNVSGVWMDTRIRGQVVRVGRDPEGLPGGFLGPGWFETETEGGVTLRRTRGARASLRLPVRRVAPLRMVVRARSEFAPPDPLQIHLLWAGEDLGGRPLPMGWTDLTWDVPARLVRAGFNTVTLRPSALPGADPGYVGRNAAAAVEWVWVGGAGTSPLVADSSRRP